MDARDVSTGRADGLTRLFAGVFALFGWGVGLAQLGDNSFFWHLETGGYILDHGIPRADPYSFTSQGTDWVAQSWLAEVLYGALDRAWGPFAIRLLGGVNGALIAGLTFLLVFHLCRDRVRAALLCVPAFGCLYFLWSERPLMLGVLGMVVLLWVVEVPDSWVGRHEPWVLVPLFWLWGNVHGSFALGFVYLGLHLLGCWLDGAPPWQGRQRRLLLGAVLGGLVLFANPYGWKLVLFPVALLSRGDILRSITEWRSPDFRERFGLAYGIWIVVFVVALALGRNRPSRRDVVVAVPFLVLALWALRNIVLAPLVMLPVVARAVAVEEPKPPEARLPLLGRALVALLGLLFVVLGVRAAGEDDFYLKSYPVAAMDVVEDEGLLGRRLLTTDFFAGYDILRYWPDQEVFIDDRYDMYPRDVVDDYFTLADGREGWDDVLERRDVEVVVWPPGVPLTELLDEDPDWERVHGDKVANVYVRR